MAIERRHVAVVTRSWGGTEGEALFTAYRVPKPPTEDSFSVRIGNDFRSAGEAISATNASIGTMLKWVRNDLEQGIENYDGFQSVVV